MAFSKRKQNGRKPDAGPMAASAEVCETRALLSADGVGVTFDETVEVTVGETEVVELEEFKAGEGEFVAELAICTMLPMELNLVEGAEEFEVAEGGSEEAILFRTCGTVVDGGEELVEGGEVVDSEFLVDPLVGEEWGTTMAYNFLAAVVDDSDVEIVDGEVPTAVDGEVFEVFITGEEEFVDVTTLEDWDPSWAYRGAVVEGEVVVNPDEEVVGGDGTDAEVTWLGWEDGLGCGVPVDGFVPEGEEFIHYAYDGITDGEGFELPVEEKDAVDNGTVVSVCEEVAESVESGETEETVSVRSLGGPNFRGGDNPEILMMSSTGVVTDDSASESSVVGPVAVAGPAMSVVTPVVNAPTTVSVFGPAVQTASVGIPVSQSSFSTLFNSDEEQWADGTLVSSANVTLETPVVSDLTSTESSLGSSLQSGSGLSVESGEGLSVELTPLLETEEEADTTEPVSESDEVIEETESSASAAIVPEQNSEVVSNNAPQVRVQSPVVVKRDRVAREIDRFMTEFALSGFVG